MKPNTYFREEASPNTSSLGTIPSRLSLDASPIDSKQSNTHQFELHLNQNEMNHLLNAMRSGLSICDRIWWFKTYKECFVGSECITWLVTNHHALCQTREEALEICNQILRSGHIRHVKNQHEFEDGYFFYVFTASKHRKDAISENENKENEQHRHPSRSYSLSNDPHGADEEMISATLGITTSQRSLNTETPTVQKEQNEQSESPKRTRFKFFADKMSIGPLDDDEMPRLALSPRMKLTQSAPVLETNVKSTKHPNLSFDRQSRTDLNDAADDNGDDEDDQFVKYYYQQFYREHVPKIEYFHDTQQSVKMVVGTGGASYSLPHYLTTNIYSTATVREMLFIATTGFRSDWLPTSVPDDLTSSNIYIMSHSKWHHFSWRDLVNEYISQQDDDEELLLNPTVAADANIVSIAAMDIGETTVLSVVWSYDSYRGIGPVSFPSSTLLLEKHNRYRCYLSTFYWRNNPLLCMFTDWYILRLKRNSECHCK